jgi:carbon monoxide dehydrogenase subunit G
MAVKVDIELAYEFSVKAAFKDVFDVLSDVPTSAGYFPKVDKLVDMGDNTYRWEMAKVGTAQVNLQTIYASTYVSDRKKGSVVWKPVKGVGNAQVSGSWKVTDKKTHTDLVLKLDGVVETPLPGLMKMVVVPVVTGEFEKLVEKYIDNLIKAFGGEA